MKEILVERIETETANGIAITELWKSGDKYIEMYRDPVSGYWTEI